MLSQNRSRKASITMKILRKCIINSRHSELNLMKRNKLIDSPKQANIFSGKDLRFTMRRHLLALSLLSFAGVFLTSIVLATSKSEEIVYQTQEVSLPNLPEEIQPLRSTINDPISSSPLISDVVAIPKNISIEPEQPVSIVVDNVTYDYVAEPETVIQAELNWQEVIIKSGDNLSRIFPRVGLTARDVYNVAQLGDDIKPLLNLKPGQSLRFAFSDDDSTKTLQQLQLQLSAVQILDVISTDDGLQASLLTRDVESRQAHATGIIKNSLFKSGIDAGLSNKLVMELAYIFGWDIDFALDLRKQDHFKLIYSEDYLDGEKIADGAIIAAEFTNQGTTFRAIRYTDDSGLSNYFSPEGDSMRKAFSRTPVPLSRISSRFNPNRKHPVLKTNRPHRGVDYAASRGTPILATGDGKIEFRGTKGGYGRTVVLTHGGKYTTLYAHMSNYKRGLKRGSRVKQGQTIGFIGSSGLATGPHLHYEFRVNGVHRNPLTVSLPKAEALPKKYLADFKQQSQQLLAQLDRLNNTVLALNN